jgi:hypothetical protein
LVDTPKTRATRRERGPWLSPKLWSRYQGSHGNGTTLDSSSGLGRGVVGGTHAARTGAYRDGYCHTDTDAQACRPAQADRRGPRRSDGDASCCSGTNGHSDSNCHPHGGPHPNPGACSDPNAHAHAHAHTSLKFNSYHGPNTYSYAHAHAHAHANLDANPYLHAHCCNGD